MISQKLKTNIRTLIENGQLDENVMADLFKLAQSEGTDPEEIESYIKSYQKRKLNNLIQISIEDGELDENEKAVIFNRAQSVGLDLEELEIDIDSRLKKRKQEKEEKEKNGKITWLDMLKVFLPWIIIGSPIILFFGYCIIKETIEFHQRDNIEIKIREVLNTDDFENAYILLDELKSLRRGGYEELRDEIVRREAIFLLSQDDEQFSKRIIYLLTQYYDSEYERNKMRKDLYELAKNVGNESAMNLLEVKEEEE